MADLDPIPSESPEAELSLSAFVKRGNDRDAGKDVPDLAPVADAPLSDAGAVEPDGAEPLAASAEPKIAASTGRPDQRTREGKRKSIQAEIDAETRRKYSAKQEADAEETRLTTLRAETARLRTTTQPVAPVAPPTTTQPSAYTRYMAMPDVPKIENYKTIEEYNFDVAEFVADKRFEERLSATQQRNQIAQQQEKFTARVHAEIAKDATFQEKLDATPVDTRIIPFLHKHEQGDEIMVYLVNHPQVAQRLITLNPIDQIGQIGGIAAELKLRADAASRGPARASSMSNAKPPIKPLGSSPAVSDDDDGNDEDLPLSQFVRKGNANDPRMTPRAARR